MKNTCGILDRGPHYYNRFRNRLLMLRHVDQKVHVGIKPEAKAESEPGTNAEVDRDKQRHVLEDNRR